MCCLYYLYYKRDFIAGVERVIFKGISLVSVCACVCVCGGGSGGVIPAYFLAIFVCGLGRRAVGAIVVGEDPSVLLYFNSR